MTSPETWWDTALDGTPLRRDGDRAYFIETPEDVFTDSQPDAPRHRWSKMRRSHYDWLAGEVDTIPAGQRVVDIGCGQSQFRDLFSDHFPCGIDFFPYPGAKVITDLNQPLPLRDGACDVAVLSNVLEHIFEPRSLLTETYRLLASGGHLLVVVPFFIKIHQPPYDFFRYTSFALDRMCHEAGFEDVRVEPIGNLFDTYDLDRSMRAKILRREAGGARRFAVRSLLWAERKCDAMMHKMVPHGLRNAPDQDGFPHSFAVHAVKK